MLKSALLIGAGIAVGAGAVQGLHAAGGPMVLTTYEANIKDEAGYTAAYRKSRIISKAMAANVLLVASTKPS